MNKLFLLIVLAIATALSACDDNHSYGGGDNPFMEKLTATLPMHGGEEVLKANGYFFSIQYVKSIQTGDTIKLKFEGVEAGPQSISGEWFKIETNGKAEETLPTEISVRAQANNTGAVRKLTFGVWNGEREDNITITQNMD